MDAIIKINNLCKTFTLTRKQQQINKTNEKRKVAVNNLSLNAYKGEIYGLLGPNGAGKTTTLRILSTLIKPDNGSATIDGIDVFNQPMEIRKKIGFLTSELKLENFFTPNYLFDFFSELYGVNETEKEDRKKMLFEKFGIEAFKEVKVADLSTGMKQKVSLVISLVHNPDIIIFDEPTNGLDVITAKTVTDFLVDLKNQGKTIILSTHIFSLVEKLCDRVGIIIDGKMALEKPLKEITQQKCLEDVFFDIYKENGGIM